MSDAEGTQLESLHLLLEHFRAALSDSMAAGSHVSGALLLGNNLVLMGAQSLVRNVTPIRSK